jgi:TetR/AcrR family transcriptional repressor of nem operon
MPQAVQRVLSEDVLDKTMHLFWRKGYANTPIEDIVEVTGFNRTVIYSRFGGKHGLFVAMLQRYRNKITNRLVAPLQDAGRGLESLIAFFQQFAELNLLTEESLGCFLIATASEVATHDEEVVNFIADFLGELRQLILAILEQARVKDELKSNIEIEAVADFLVGNVMGLMTMSRSPVPKEALLNHIKGIVLFISAISRKKQSSIIKTQQ